MKRTTIRHALLRAALAAVGLACHVPWSTTAADKAPISRDCTTPEHRQLDFWIGDWDTVESGTPGGPPIARARVERIADGCAIRERYVQNDGLIGDSILSYDPVHRRWQQTWVTNRGALMVIAGTFEDDALVLQGDVRLGDGSSVLQRITWTAQGAGVRESAVRSRDGGTTWEPAFDVLFLKREGSADREPTGAIAQATPRADEPAPTCCERWLKPAACRRSGRFPSAGPISQ